MTQWLEFKSKWLQFNIIVEHPKTKCFGVYNKIDFLGLIEWRNGWRQYVFTPIKDTVWATSCLDDLSRFIKEQMEAKKITVVSKT